MIQISTVVTGRPRQPNSPAQAARSHCRLPSGAEPAAGASWPGWSRRVASTAVSATTQTTTTTSPCCAPAGCGKKSPAISTSTIQCRAATDHCRYARSRPAYSRSGPSWIIVSSRWVSGLSMGWRPVSSSTTKAIPNSPHQCAGCDQMAVPAAPAHIARRSVLPTGSAASNSTSARSASPATANVRSRPALISPKPLPVSQAESAIVKRANASSPTTTRASCPSAERGRRRVDRDDQQRRQDGHADRRRRQHVHHAGACRLDDLLAPQSPEVAIRLQRGRSQSALEAGLLMLDRARGGAGQATRPATTRPPAMRFALGHPPTSRARMSSTSSSPTR